MTAIAHTLISLPFGFYLHNPMAIFLAALVAHLLLDTLLHWNIYPAVFGRYFHLAALVDVTLALIFSWLILGEKFFTLPIWLAIIGGNTPDIMHVSWDIINPSIRQKYLWWLQPFFNFHEKLQLETASFWHGIIWQAILVAFSLLLIH